MEKTPFTRLLDLTAGWSQFVDREQDVSSSEEVAAQEAWTDPAVSVDDLCDLYQQAGNLVGIDETLAPEEEARRVRAFVEHRILPLLLRESPQKPRFAATATLDVAEPVAA